MTTTKSRPSSIKGRHYTREEYDLLGSYIGNKNKTLVTHILKMSLTRDIKLIKRSINSDLTAEIYDAIYNTDLNDLPLLLDDKDIIKTICQWRFQINK